MIQNYLTFISTKYLQLQSPLTSLRTYDVKHSRFVTHFRTLKIQVYKF